MTRHAYKNSLLPMWSVFWSSRYASGYKMIEAKRKNRGIEAPSRRQPPTQLRSSTEQEYDWTVHR